MKNKRVALILLTLLVAIFMMTFAAACEVTGDPDALGIADMNFGNRLVTGLLVFVLGLAMVFIVLFVLIGCIKLVELLIALPEKLAKKNAVEAVKEEKREEEQRLEEGMVDEVKGLLDSGISPDSLIYYGLEYKYLTLYAIGRLTYEEMFSQLETAIHQFAKRQMTWFRGMERRGLSVHWIDAALPMEKKLEQIENLLKAGANINAQDKKGRTVRDYAKENIKNGEMLKKVEKLLDSFDTSKKQTKEKTTAVRSGSTGQGKAEQKTSGGQRIIAGESVPEPQTQAKETGKKFAEPWREYYQGVAAREKSVYSEDEKSPYFKAEIARSNGEKLQITATPQLNVSLNAKDKDDKNKVPDYKDFDDEANSILASLNINALRWVKSSEIERISMMCDGKIVSRIEDATEESLGNFTECIEELIGT